MNVTDSETIAGTFERAGWEETSHLDEANILVINSCSVRQAAEDSVYGLAKKVKSWREIKPEGKVILTGCLVGSVRGERKRFEEKELKNKLPWVDDFFQLEDFIKLITPPFEPKRQKTNHAFVTISTGCDNFCTYCVVPYARGKEISRPQNEILKEINQLVEKGYSQVTLLGQNVNSWGISNLAQKMSIRTNTKTSLPFADLLRNIHNLEGVKKISFLSSNPFDFTLDLVATLQLPKIDRQLHLPVQTGDNEILRRMNRRHTREEYLQLLKNIRLVVPDIKISTDLIVGFPGETEEHFANTVDLCQQAKFSLAFISMYSPRPGTNAFKFYQDNVPLAEKRRRHHLLMENIKKYR